MPGQQLEDPAASSQILKQRQFSKDYDISQKKLSKDAVRKDIFLLLYMKKLSKAEKKYIYPK